MRKLIFTAAILALSSPLVAQRTVNCASANNRRHFCPANTRNGVVLLQENSDNVCQQGSTWSYTPRGITVSGGCDAQFQIGGNNGGNGVDSTNSLGAYQNNNRDGADRNNSNGSNGNNGSSNNSNGNYGNNGNNGNPRNNDNSYGNSNQNQNNGNGYPNNQNGNYGNNGNNQNGYGNNGDRNRQQAQVVLPSGTRLDLRLEQTVSASDVNQGDFIPMTLVNDLSVNGRVVAPSGTSVQAKVTSAHGSPLDIRLDSMSVNGQNYPLLSNSIHSARDSQSGQSAGNQSAGQALGSLIGNLGGGAQLPSGSVYTFRLTSQSRPTNTNQ